MQVTKEAAVNEWQVIAFAAWLDKESDLASERASQAMIKNHGMTFCREWSAAAVTYADAWQTLKLAATGAWSP